MRRANGTGELKLEQGGLLASGEGLSWQFVQNRGSECAEFSPLLVRDIPPFLRVHPSVFLASLNFCFHKLFWRSHMRWVFPFTSQNSRPEKKELSFLSFLLSPSWSLSFAPLIFQPKIPLIGVDSRGLL